MQDLYETYKPLLFKIAYQMTGSINDAEDAVQDVFLKMYKMEKDVDQPKAYLCKMVTNRCLDLLKSARKRREQYVGEWLPEPIISSDSEFFDRVYQGQQLSYAMLVLMEKLSPSERAVFVLRNAFDFGYKEIAELTEKSEANCRKLFSRANEKMGITEEHAVLLEKESEAWVSRFLQAFGTGNVESVLEILSEEVVLISDGGGKAVAALHPIISRERVAKFLFGLLKQMPQYGESISFDVKNINGQAGIVILSDGEMVTAILLHVENDCIQNLYFIRNPDKLAKMKAVL
ncbi:RNA polymerase sigma-70 factor [Fictibacillus iocasae]|uniref:RNA polymerase sigma-70 factor n=1 Tax=Fictibacillus iocasae TaxID=2715437 RepID=A0ABW2NRJ8_9BACL